MRYPTVKKQPIQAYRSVPAVKMRFLCLPGAYGSSDVSYCHVSQIIPMGVIYTHDSKLLASGMDANNHV